jgi:2-dehydro-3-deoxy-D-gluconate 5-dehydrogenase
MTIDIPQSLGAFCLDGRAAPVTGASAGVGAAMAIALAEAGADVAAQGHSRSSRCIETDVTTALRTDEIRNRQMLDRSPAGRRGRPDDLAGALVFLASPASMYVHGHVLAVDDGRMGR